MKTYKQVVALILIAGVFTLLTCKSKPKSDNDLAVNSVINEYSIVSLIQSTTVTKADDFTYNEILSMTREAVKLAGGLEGIVKRGDTVILKPNVVNANYGWGGGNPLPELVNGIATDWRVIQSVAVIVREIIGPAGKIILMEGPAGGPSERYFNIVGWTKANLTAVDEIIGLETEGTWSGPGIGTDADTEITLLDFDYKQADNAKLEWGVYKYNDYYKNDGKYWVNKKMLQANALICIPVVKTHNAAGGVTGAIKNIGIGAAPPNVYGIANGSIGRNAMVNHSSMAIHDWISDYYRCLPADFVVMDGLQGLQNGPAGQQNFTALQRDHKNLRCILASKDALAIDTVEANIMNWETPKYLKNIADKTIYARGEIGKANPKTIPHRADSRNITVVGNKKVDDVRGDQNKTAPGSAAAAWSGSLNNGGRKLTAAQLSKPAVTINSAVFSGSNLNLALSLSSGTNNNTVKIDVYIDGQYKASFNNDLSSVTLDASGIPSGEHSIEVYAFTKYMSHAVGTITAVK